MGRTKISKGEKKAKGAKKAGKKGLKGDMGVIFCYMWGSFLEEAVEEEEALVRAEEFYLRLWQGVFVVSGVVYAYKKQA